MPSPEQQGWIKTDTALTQQGREITLYQPGNSSTNTLNTLIIGVFHGDEREAALLAQAFLTYASTDRFDNPSVGVIPILNPDGYEKNTRINASGVDLNRNFPTRDWAELNLDTIYYSGTAAASEQETQFLLSLLEKYAPAKIITLHTPYKVINFDGPAEALANAMAVHNGYPVVADIGYSTPGSFGTYVGKERHIPTITLELPEENFDETALAQNLAALEAAIQWTPGTSAS